MSVILRSGPLERLPPDRGPDRSAIFDIVSIVETLLIFVGIPLAVIVLVTLAVYGRSTVHQPNRYRPGKAWTYPPAWYEPHPEAIHDAVSQSPAIEGSPGATVVGGASGEW